jgi:glycosyltransferase involved in cell wall biosynthesis
MKIDSNKATCVIPFYNENTRTIVDIIITLLNVEEIDKIVIVDDGSVSKKTFNFLKNKCSENKNIKVLRLAKNYGKSFAVRFGLTFTTNENIFLLDADLKNLDKEEISESINKFVLLDLEMLILRRVNSLPLVKLIRADTLLSGERIIKKSHLKKILISGVDGYELEVATNQYFIDNKLEHKCFWSPSSAVNNYKFRKLKFLKGIFKDFKMYLNLIRYIGIRNYFNQVFNFCKINV